ncbi:MAG TPA: BatD family protein [Haliangiales bacterium]|nr:BatD family protein [Haliangiales bacterium]
MRRRLALVLLLAAGAATAAGARVEINVTVAPATGSMDSVFDVVLELNVHGMVTPDRVTPPDMTDFEVLSRMEKTEPRISFDSRGRQEVAVNLEWRWRLRPRHPGKLTVGEARASVDGAEYRTKPVVVDVLAAPGAAAPGTTPSAPPAAGTTPPPELGRRPFFLYAVADRAKVYQGDQITVTWLFYARDTFNRIEPRPPRLDAFWSETLYEATGPLKFQQETIGNQEYIVAPVAKKALFPTRSGKLVIPSYGADVHSFLEAPQRLASQEIAVDVQPLPPGAPRGFDPGAVGRFEVEASIDRTTLPAGEPLTLDVVVHGTGAIRRMQIPALRIDGIEVTPPHDFDERVDRTGEKIGGERKYRYLLAPRRGGSLAVGPIEIPYFDPDKGAYETARAAQLSVTVVGDPSALPRPAGAAGENVIARDLRPPHEEPGASAGAAERFHRSRGFAVALGAPAGLYVLVLAGDWLRRRLRRETPRARWRRARGRARKRLRAAEVHIRWNRPAPFFGEIARVLTEHIEERVGEPVAALTRDQLRDLLSARGFPEPTVKGLVTELETCDFARFAPAASGPGEMRSALRRTKSLLGAIEQGRPS